MKSSAFATAAMGFAMLFASQAASAEPAASDPQVQAPASQGPFATPFASATAVDEAELGETRGGAGMTITTGDNGMVAGSSQDATSTNNSVNNAVTGNVTVSDNAFQNSSGFIILNSNTGNNVAINSSMNVNIVTPPPR